MTSTDKHIQAQLELREGWAKVLIDAVGHDPKPCEQPTEDEFTKLGKLLYWYIEESSAQGWEGYNQTELKAARTFLWDMGLMGTNEPEYMYETPNPNADPYDVDDPAPM